MLPQTQYTEFFSNIGAIKLDVDQKSSILDYFFLFTLPWEYIPDEIDSQKVINHFKRHYDNEMAEMYIKALNANVKYRFNVAIK